MRTLQPIQGRVMANPNVSSLSSTRHETLSSRHPAKTGSGINLGNLSGSQSKEGPTSPEEDHIFPSRSSGRTRRLPTTNCTAEEPPNRFVKGTDTLIPAVPKFCRSGSRHKARNAVVRKVILDGKGTADIPVGITKHAIPYVATPESWWSFKKKSRLSGRNAQRHFSQWPCTIWKIQASARTDPQYAMRISIHSM